MNVREIQTALLTLGYDLGPAGADGAFGRRTVAAIAKFQSDRQVDVLYPGTVGAKTQAALAVALATLTPVPRVGTVPLLPWLAEAERLQGVREIAGAKHNATIMDWAKRLGGWVASFYTNDEIPWCGLFVAHCIGSTLTSEPLPANPLGAVNWSKFGVSCLPTRGAVLVFSRSGGGHVGFYVGEDKEAFHVLGGNQSNQVNITRVAKSRHVATRWPATVPAPIAVRTLKPAGGALSTNEA